MHIRLKTTAILLADLIIYLRDGIGLVRYHRAYNLAASGTKAGKQQPNNIAVSVVESHGPPRNIVWGGGAL